MSRTRVSSHGGISAAAAAFEFTIVWATVVAAILLGVPERVTVHQWVALAVLVPLIATVHLLGSDREKSQGSHLSLAPMFAAVLLLPPLLAAAAIAAAFVPEWLRTRVPWYVVVFNVANFVGPALAARAVFDALASPADGQGWTIAVVAALATFLVLQYAVLATMLKLARDVRPGETLRRDCVLIDAGLLSLGAAGAALWHTHPALVVLTLLPLALAYRSLAIPGLVEASRVEPKTGLFNMRHFHSALSQELGRAARFGRPIALLMIDVDHLRQINNARGHVAGDEALRLVSDTIRATTREYDVAARFGGDEFCVLLPETQQEGAMTVAERLRSRVERAGAEAGLPVTVSIGIAAVATGGVTSEDLVTLADRAAYRAKFSGRNAVALPPEGDPVHEAERVLLDALKDE